MFRIRSSCTIWIQRGSQLRSSAPASCVFVACRGEDVHVPFQRRVKGFSLSASSMPPHGRVGCCWGITALREHECTQDAKAHNRYATNYIRLPSVSKQSPLPLSFFFFCFFTLTSSSFWSSTWNSKNYPIKSKKSWQSQWTFLLPPICNRISVVFFTQHLRTSSSSSSPPWAQYHVIVFPLIYVFLGNLSTLRHCNIQREYQNLNRNPLPSPSPAPPALPRQQMTLGFLNPRPEPAAVLDRQTDREFKIKRAVANSPPPAHRRTEIFFPDKIQTLSAKQKPPCLLRLPSITR